MNFLAIDIGGSKIMMGIVTGDGEIIYSKYYKLPLSPTEAVLIETIKTAYSETPEHMREKIKTAGITIPGLADSKRGVWVNAPYSGINNFHICDKLKPILNADIYIENDVNACALAERRFGICQDVDDFFWLTVSNGCGGSIFADGELYTGSCGNAGEIGHIVVEENEGFLCGCKNTGCLEVMASGPGIARRYTELIGCNNIQNSKAVSDLARSGDKIAVEVFEKTGYYLGKALACVSNLLNPGKIVIGGGVMNDYDLFEGIMMSTYKRMIFVEANRNCTIEKTGLGYNAALLGAATLCMK